MNTNENIKELNSNNQITTSKAVTIVNTTNPSIYQDYLDKLNQIYTTTTEENSVISEYVVNNNKCSHTLIIRELNGNKTLALSNEFEYNDSFKNEFLEAMIQDYKKHNSVLDCNIVTVENDLTSIIIRTKENDTLTIRNIDIDLASKINDQVMPKQELNSPNKTLMKKIDEKGIGNTFVILLTVLLIGITLVGTIFFTIMSKK